VTALRLSDREQYNMLLRTDLVFFATQVFATLHPGTDYIHNWHIEAIEAALQRAQEGHTRRLLITMPPRHMKSICVSVAWVAFLLGHNPSLRIILVSYGQELSGVNLRLLRRVLESEWYRSAFPEVDLTSATQNELLTRDNGFVRAMSTGGVFTGFGADYIIYDDPMKQSDAQSSTERARVLSFYQGTILTRTNDPRTARIVIVMQRVHEDDLANHAIQSGEYDVLCLPSVAEQVSEHRLYDGRILRRQPGDLLWPEVFSQTVLDTRKREVGDYEFALQYQQNPIPLGGGMIRIDQIQRHEIAPDRNRCSMVVQSIDTGMSDAPNADPSVIMTLGYCDGAWRLLDIQRRRLRWDELLDMVAAQMRVWRPDSRTVDRRHQGLQPDGPGSLRALFRPCHTGRGGQPGHARRGDRAGGARQVDRPSAGGDGRVDRAHHGGGRRLAARCVQAPDLCRRARPGQPLRLRACLA
jgi:hypothetical protein